MTERQLMAAFIIGGTVVAIILAAVAVALIIIDGPVSDVQLPTL